MAYNKKIIELYGDNYRKTQINILPDDVQEQFAKFKINVNKKPQQDNKIKKYIGIYYQKNKFNSRFSFNKKNYYVGRFDTELEATPS